MRNRRVIALLQLALLASRVAWATEPDLRGSEPGVAAIDTYGLNRVSREAVLAAARIDVGDRPPTRDEIKCIEQKLAAIPGVEQADVSVIHLRGPRGSLPQPTVYVGIREAGRPAIAYREAPTANLSLPDELVETYGQLDRAVRESFREGQADDAGFALSGSEAVREIQTRLIPLANKHFAQLVEVLRTAESVEHRAIAAWVLVYGDDKAKAATELDAAARDGNPRVRNNAMRALGVILEEAKDQPELLAAAPIDTYLELLDSLEWTDRNKAMFVLLGLSDGNPEAILTKLRTRSRTLTEMARWNTAGHAQMAFVLIGRCSGMSDPEISAAWQEGRREEVLRRLTD